MTQPVAKRVQRKTEITQPGIIVQVSLNDIGLSKTFEMFYPAADMQLNYIFNLSKDAGVSGEIIKLASSEIKKTTTEQIKELEDSAIQAEAVLAGQGLKSAPKTPTILESESHTPHAMDFVKLFNAADRALDNVRMLWVASIISDDEKASNERAIRSHCHTVSELISKNFKRILTIINNRPATNKPVAAVVAPVVAPTAAPAKPKAKPKAKVAVAA